MIGCRHLIVLHVVGVVLTSAGLAAACPSERLMTATEQACARRTRS